jgi:N-acetylglucosaminyl-diphospho-decaprenol L-rhamnosyltransferase
MRPSTVFLTEMPLPLGTTTVVLVNFNSGAHLETCLRSVSAHAPHAEVIVVDNASTDGSEAVAAGHEPQVSLIRNSVNAGFARAVNQALAVTRGDCILILNPDCVLFAGALQTLERELGRHPECAIAAPAILDEDGSLQGSVRGDPTMLTGLFGRTTLLTRLFPNSHPARRNIQTADADRQSRTADWVSGACMLARRSAIEAVGGFDERYFLYWEDADLCRRLRARGYTTRYVPGGRVMHVGGRSSQTARGAAIRAFHRSAFTYYATHVARGRLTRAVAWLLLTGRCQWKLLASRVARES